MTNPLLSRPSAATPAPPSTPPVASPAGMRPFFRSFTYAWDGLMYALTQRNMKFHVVSAVLVGLAGGSIRLGLAEKVTLIFCVLLVFFAEILNTALEALVDLHTQDYRDLAKVTKDTAAGGVLVLAVGTVVIFAALVVHNWSAILLSGPLILRQWTVGVPLAGITAALLSPRQRPRWVDDACFALALALWGLLWSWSVSSVFTSLTGLLVGVAWRWSRRRPAVR